MRIRENRLSLLLMVLQQHPEMDLISANRSRDKRTDDKRKWRDTKLGIAKRQVNCNTWCEEIRRITVSIEEMWIS